MRTLVLSVLMAGLLAGCVVYDGPYRRPPAYGFVYGYGYAPYHHGYGFHHDRGPDCWRCDW